MTVRLSSLCLLFLIWTHTAFATKVKVEWLEPEKYTDVRSVNQSKANFQKHVFSKLEEHFKYIAKDLPPELTLYLTITNLNLAGEIRYNFAMSQEIRLVNRLFWPSIKLKYQLKYENEVIKSDQVTIKDMAFLDASRRYHNDFLSHEKNLYRRWFIKTIKPEIEQWQKRHNAVMQ